MHETGRIEYKIVQQILIDEGSQHFEELERAFGRVVGFRQINEVSKKIFDTAVSDAVDRNVFIKNGDFLSISENQPDQPSAQLRSRANLPQISRNFDYVPPAEIELAIYQIVEDAFSIHIMDIPPVVVQRLGFEHITQAVTHRLIGIVIDMLLNGRLALRQEWITIPKYGTAQPDEDFYKQFLTYLK
ncbi:MAG: hypothetical protein AAF490_25610 [Chloroflexota bacterium]